MRQKISLEYKGHLKTLSPNWNSILKSILEQREEILTAFIAKYGCQPDEAEQITQHDKDGNIIYYVRMKKIKND
jgi:hypothetical protein